MDPTDSLSLWINFDWARTFGDRTADGDAYGIAAAGRVALTDNTGLALRYEYIRATQSYTGGPLAEIQSLTGTIDHSLTDDLKIRFEARWDHILDNELIAFVNGQNGANNSSGASLSSRDSQVVGLAEIYYEF